MKFNWNDGWLFTKDAKLVSGAHSALNVSAWETVDLPHTWNAKDGQDGGNDYYRGTCYYTKRLNLSDCKGAKHIYLEFEGANSSADVYVNGEKVTDTYKAFTAEDLAGEGIVVKKGKKHFRKIDTNKRKTQKFS